MKTLPRFQTIDTQDFTDGKVPVWDADNYKFVPGDAAPVIITITGSFEINGLPIGDKVEVLTDHHTDAIFTFCEYPVITNAPAGVVISVLAHGVDNDPTNGQQFVLLIENVSATGDGGYSEPTFMVDWSRKGWI